MRLESPAALTRGDRFIVRAYSPAVTIGGGEVLDPDPPRTAVRTEAARRRFAALSANALDAIVQIIRDAGGHGIPLTALTSRAGVRWGNVSTVEATLEASGRARRVVDRLVATEVVNEASRRLLTLVGDFHRTQPLADGLPREEARERILAAAHPAVFELVVGELAAAGKLVARERLALPGHRLELSPEESRTREVVEALYKQSGLKPPDAATIAAEGRVTPAVAERMTALLLRQKQLAKIDTLIFHVDALAALKSEIQGLKAAAPAGRATVDVATFKDRFGVSRKFAIPLLEWLDRERVTRRMGETRVVL